MNQINDEVLKAREVVAGYKRFNQKTVEAVKEYNPKLRIWTFVKKEIDPAAGEFVKNYIKTPKKEKQVNTKTPAKKTAKKVHGNKKPKPKKIAVKKEERLKVAKVKIKATKPCEFDQTTITAQAYNYYLEGKSYDEIATLIGRNKRATISMIGARNRQLGIFPEKSDSYERVVELIKKGKSIKDIAKILGIRSPVVSYHSNKYHNSKTEEEKEADKQELLQLIKDNMKKNNVNYCYSSWISSVRCKMKANLSSVLRGRLCDELIKEGRLKENVEGKTRPYGRMYLIP